MDADLRELIKAARLARTALREHVQYDDGDEPSLESEAFDALDDALEPFKNAVGA